MATQTPTLEVNAREKIGTRYAKRDRAAGLIPAVIYGHKKGPVHVTVDAKAFTELLHHEVHIIDVKLDGKSEHTLIKAVQWDTYGVEIIHVDLERVDMSETIEVEVELQLVGEPVALREAGTVLDHPTTMVKISCRADAIPSHLEHDISELAAGVPVTVADINLPSGITIVMPEEQLICQITGVKVAASVAEALEGDDADGAEPEVINKGKEEESEA
ncbi:MAG: 50S ribosomal protein L25 [Phycisphaeraceae bacterium]